MTMERITVTADNLETVRETMHGRDQAEELVVGCETWGILYQPGNQRGQMTVWPNGRAAIMLGGNSAWGDWIDGQMLTDDGELYDSAGELIE